MHFTEQARAQPRRVFAAILVSRVPQVSSVLLDFQEWKDHVLRQCNHALRYTAPSGTSLDAGFAIRASNNDRAWYADRLILPMIAPILAWDLPGMMTTNRLLPLLWHSQAMPRTTVHFSRVS